ncbi:MAG: winged helix-turn-helix domain-containing protein [Candidatus Nanoarchaeia archaeon]|nr:winged helix-turn-helix domain-containing protein [Candidatus Nanoarchaeia archaeon]
MAQKRNKIDIVNDMLNSIHQKGEIKPTHLMYKSNLSHSLMKVYLEELIEKELIKETHKEYKGHKHNYFIITEKGIDFLLKFKKMKEFEDTFGL